VTRPECGAPTSSHTPCRRALFVCIVIVLLSCFTNIFQTLSHLDDFSKSLAWLPMVLPLVACCVAGAVYVLLRTDGRINGLILVLAGALALYVGYCLRIQDLHVMMLVRKTSGVVPPGVSQVELLPNDYGLLDKGCHMIAVACGVFCLLLMPHFVRRCLSDSRPAHCVQEAMTSFHDSILGKLRRLDDEDGWEGTFVCGSNEIQIRIAGADSPDTELMQRAHQLLDGMEHFSSSVSAFIDENALRMPAWSSELCKLEIESIYFPWPARPNDGMVFFRGPNPDRGWRCEFRGARLLDLGFDS
jgi:hypothetical protein